MKAALANGANFWNGGEIYGDSYNNSLHLLNRYFTANPEDADKVILSVKSSPPRWGMTTSGIEDDIRRSVDECLEVLKAPNRLIPSNLRDQTTVSPWK